LPLFIRSFLNRMPSDQQEAYSNRGFQQGLEAVERCVLTNEALIKDMIADVASMFENKEAEEVMDMDEDRIVVVSA
jgi:hypothetical protein